MESVLQFLKIINIISILLIIILFIWFWILKVRIIFARHSLYQSLKNKYPTIRISLWYKEYIRYIIRYIMKNDLKTFIDKFYIQPYRLIKSWGDRTEMEMFYRSYFDIDAIILTWDEVLKEKLELFFRLFTSYIRSIGILLLLIFLVFFTNIILNAII